MFRTVPQPERFQTVSTPDECGLTLLHSAALLSNIESIKVILAPSCITNHAGGDHGGSDWNDCFALGCSHKQLRCDCVHFYILVQVAVLTGCEFARR